MPWRQREHMGLAIQGYAYCDGRNDQDKREYYRVVKVQLD
jgi:hypothetical protein